MRDIFKTDHDESLPNGLLLDKIKTGAFEGEETYVSGEMNPERARLVEKARQFKEREPKETEGPEQ